MQKLAEIDFQKATQERNPDFRSHCIARNWKLTRALVSGSLKTYSELLINDLIKTETEFPSKWLYVYNESGNYDT